MILHENMGLSCLVSTLQARGDIIVIRSLLVMSLASTIKCLKVTV
uniref:Uncharacterized protein n=1 Tax=Takifugu rubripes TaxID=31033 RepID=A0A674ME58_TAKRU